MSDDTSGGDARGSTGSDPSGDVPDDGPSGPGPDPTTPRVDLALHGITVSVTGRSEDELDTVEESARNLMEYLVEKNEELEDDPDEYGLS